MGKSDIYIKREKWKDGYHSVARCNGRFVASEKWDGKKSTRKVSDKVWEKNITKEPNVHGFLFRTKTTSGEDRSLKVFSKRRVFIGDQKSRRLDTGPMRKYMREKKYCNNDIESQKDIDWSGLKLKSTYQFGVKVGSY